MISFDDDHDEPDEDLLAEDLSPLMQALLPKVTACRIREYEPDDLEACIDIHRSNQPDHVAPGDLDAFVEFLKVGTSYLLVIEHGGDVIACGGVELVGDPDSATLVHTMVHREYQRRGFGSSLMVAQLSLLEPEERPTDLWVETCAEAAGFYQSIGFELESDLSRGSSGLALPTDRSTKLWLSVASADVDEARQVLMERNIHMVLNEDEEDAEEDDT